MALDTCYSIIVDIPNLCYATHFHQQNLNKETS